MGISRAAKLLIEGFENDDEAPASRAPAPLALDSDLDSENDVEELESEGNAAPITPTKRKSLKLGRALPSKKAKASEKVAKTATTPIKGTKGARAAPKNSAKGKNGNRRTILLLNF
ncbi:hypothetical protein OQA88_7099 [Cercophora sp. LCS_1]